MIHTLTEEVKKVSMKGLRMDMSCARMLAVMHKRRLPACGVGKGKQRADACLADSKPAAGTDALQGKEKPGADDLGAIAR